MREIKHEIIQLGFIDVYRKFHQKRGLYLVVKRFQSKGKYIFASKELDNLLKCSFVPNLDISDHCPVVVDIQL